MSPNQSSTGYSNASKSKRIIVTGGYGFIGSNLIIGMLAGEENFELVNIDLMTYAADRENIGPYENDPRYSAEFVDIRDREAVHSIFADFRPDELYHLAAESHVDNSISEPGAFITTNLLGTYNLLEEVRLLASQGHHCRMLHVSTDEVFGSLEESGAFTEDSRYMPNSPYSASKAGSDHLVRAWHHTYGLDMVTTNCSNNFGPRQHSEKLIPTVIRTALAGRPIPVYGDGKNVRDWLYVDDHCRALMTVMKKGVSGETYLVGTRNEWANIDLVQLICELLDEETGAEKGSHAGLITFVTDRPGHDRRYAVDPSRIEMELGWSNSRDFRDEMRETVRWYVTKFGYDSSQEN